MYPERPSNAVIHRNYLNRIYLRDKIFRGKDMDIGEEVDFSGLCLLGPKQIMGCYGADFGHEGFSYDDFLIMCQDCPYALSKSFILSGVLSIAYPYFIFKEFSALLDMENEIPENFVYFVSDGKYVKIGVTNNIKKRISALQTANARKLETFALIPTKNSEAAHKLEKELHSVYEQFLVNGEWFDILGFLIKPFFKHKFDPQKHGL